MILGGNPETAILVDIAKSMGVYTVVVDMSPNSPAKKEANESYDIDVFEVDKIVALVKELDIQAVLVGVADILVKPYKEICDILGFPCYATDLSVEAFCSKDGFKKYCIEYGVQDIPGIYLDKTNKITKPDNLDFPLMIKPVDNGGGVGMKICRDYTDYELSVQKALNFSKKGVVLIEKYMECEDMAAYYTFKDGVPYLSATYDRITSKEQGDASPVCIGAIYPSKHLKEFEEKVHPKLSSFFTSLGIKNGVLNLQFFVENNQFYAYDPGFRLQGEAPHIHLNRFNHFDHRRMLIDFAFTGVFGEADFNKKNDPSFKGKIACTIWVLLSSGVIHSIEGLEIIKSDKQVHFVLQRFSAGDEVTEEMLGTERQVFSRIYLEADSIVALEEKIKIYKNQLKVLDQNGNNMILYWMDPKTYLNS